MYASGPNRAELSVGRSRPTRNTSEAQESGLSLAQIVAGVMENWGEIEEQMPWYQPPQTDREPVRQQAVEAQRPQKVEEKKKSDATVPALAESEDSPLLGLPGVNKVKEVKEENRAKTPEEKTVAQQQTEVFPQALAWRAPELPKSENGSMPASFAVPNHSAGASGFGNTWSHAAAATGAKGESIVHSE